MTDNGEHLGRPVRTCATMNEHRRLLSESATYREARSAIENRVIATARNAARRVGPVRIPVVVHVVWQQPAQNVSDAQVHSQLAALNRDYRRANADVDTVPAVFAGLVADAQIAFVLADEDPAGGRSTGITRRQTDVPSFPQPGNPVKSAATGGTDAWPADRYLNLWVCQLTAPLLGYAQFPGGPAETDGVVITHTAFGTTGTVRPPFNLGRTLVHEVGHWLDLFHIWGDDGTGCGGTDGVEDTPGQAGANVGTPRFPHVTCDNGPNGDLFMNYLDYVDDRAMVMFTAGQVDRMKASLEGPRAWVLAVQPTVPDPDPVDPDPDPVDPDPDPVDPVPDPGPRSAVGAGPLLAGSGGRLEVFGLGPDRCLGHRSWDGTTWAPAAASAAERRGGVWCSRPEVAAWGPDRLDVFLVGTTSALSHKWWDGSRWRPSETGFESLGGSYVGPPAAVARTTDRLDVVLLGTDSALRHKWWDGSRWQPGPTSSAGLGGPFAGPPVLVSPAAGRLELFAVGVDHAVAHRSWTESGGWAAGWDRLPGPAVRAVAAAAGGPDRLDVVAVGLDCQVRHLSRGGGSWAPEWAPLGVAALSAPTAAAPAPDRLHVAVVDVEGLLRHTWWDGTSWRPDGWASLGPAAGQPRLAAADPDRVHLVVAGADSALCHRWWDGERWQTAPAPLAGPVLDF